MQEEFARLPDYSNNDLEWQDIVDADQPPPSSYAQAPAVPLADDDFEAVSNNGRFRYRLRPVASERHVGIDQGIRNFAVVAVDKFQDSAPKIVYAQLYNDLDLPARFKAADVVLALADDNRQLLSLMQLPGHEREEFARVDRVVVHVEQMCFRNANAKTFGIELAQLLQRMSPDPRACAVALSNPNLHCAGGPAFQLGDEIAQALSLKPTSTFDAISDVNPASRKRSSDGNQLNNYDARKKMSADVFRYVVEADAAKLAQMKIDVDNDLRQHWRRQLDEDPLFRLHDVGDAFLHALRGIVCGSSTFRQVSKSLRLMLNCGILL